MKRKLTCLLLAAALTLSAAAAAEGFPAVNSYSGFPDVTQEDWFYPNVKLCYETGLMTGTGQGFQPGNTLTIGEVAAIAVRLHARLTGGSQPDGAQPDQPWFQPYVSYLTGLGLTVPSGEKNATRLDFVKLLSGVLPQELLSPINSISALPDCNDSDVLAFCAAGILTGIDKYGTFAGDRTLTRSECAAMVSRVVRTDLRLSFTPISFLPFTAAGLTPDVPFFQGGVTAGDFLPVILSLISELERASAAAAVEFNWYNTYDGQTYLDYVNTSALTQLGVTAAQGLPIYREFDVQVYYSRYLSLAKGKM